MEMSEVIISHATSCDIELDGEIYSPDAFDGDEFVALKISGALKMTLKRDESKRVIQIYNKELWSESAEYRQMMESAALDQLASLLVEG